jgi:hypothetical protein
MKRKNMILHPTTKQQIIHFQIHSLFLMLVEYCIYTWKPHIAKQNSVNPVNLSLF